MPLSPLFEQSLDNAEEVTTRGVEFDIAWLFANYWDLALRAAYSDPSALNSVDAMRIVPSSAGVYPLIAETKVLLPAPLRPRRA